MKTKLITAISIIALTFSSCKLDSEYSHTPSIVIVSAVTNNQDTLTFGSLDTESFSGLLMDTVSVSDTVNFTIILHSYTNILKEFHLTPSDDNKSGFIFPKDSLDKFCLPSSDYEKGIFHFKGEYIQLPIIFRYIPDKVSNDARLNMRVLSDAKSGYEENRLVVKTPFSKAKTDNKETTEE
ncbi:MAG: hypothetical protein LBH80_01085 [Prevotellaceae bacterium]|jgi:hypothetical protein|nr:hypothetical protein [Prevotellaceae bacterium]